MANEALQLNGVSHAFAGLEVLRELSLTVTGGEFVAVVGPSGCGKTTLLNILSGHLQPASGNLQGAAQTRTIYQQGGLFPWLTVGENIGLGLRHLKTLPEAEKQSGELLELVGLQGFAGHYPHQLSGGMKQRAELARALAGECNILLLDEPFSALDYLNRLRLRQELALLLEKRPRTVVLVTHDVEEAAQLADRIIVLSERPATIRCEISIAAARPRSPTQTQVLTAVEKVLSALGLRQATTPDGAAPISVSSNGYHSLERPLAVAGD